MGLQTDAPLKRAIMPNDGLRMVLSSLKAYGVEPSPSVVETFSKHRKTHNDGRFDACCHVRIAPWIKAWKAKLPNECAPAQTTEGSER